MRGSNMIIPSVYTHQFLIEYPEVFNNFKSRDNINISCDSCQNIIQRKVKNAKSKIKKGSLNAYCSNACQAQTISTIREVSCTYCAALIIRSQREYDSSSNHFCNSSCAAKYNNKLTPKRTPEGKCKKCYVTIPSYRTYCSPCYDNLFNVDWDNITYGEIKSKRKYQRNSPVRVHARSTYLSSGRPQKCCNCSYDKHFEICHIKAISVHDDDTLISTINHPDNIIALCPNCHWELDYGDLTINDILSDTQ